MTAYGFVPEQETDFIFCTIGEEWGLMGTSATLLLFTLLLLRILALAERQRSDFTRIYAYAVASILFMHFAINVGMVLGLAPVIGIPLPFISAGGCPWSDLPCWFSSCYGWMPSASLFCVNRLYMYFIE